MRMSLFLFVKLHVLRVSLLRKPYRVVKFNIIVRESCVNL
jgi:hypothetical protein